MRMKARKDAERFPGTDRPLRDSSWAEVVKFVNTGMRF